MTPALSRVRWNVTVAFPLASLSALVMGGVSFAALKVEVNTTVFGGPGGDDGLLPQAAARLAIPTRTYLFMFFLPPAIDVGLSVLVRVIPWLVSVRVSPWLVFVRVSPCYSVARVCLS